ncbi:DUF4352 domain-containing protein [Clostridium fallax]|uniref:DUF4352 domain-containing protein n=1 Tax=Clostridium fallax TaxID=1533 RepID=A0A1M4ZMW7_9CLOT|nr:DUF4352 domain-containing protein [Clostridium fallax]SHF19147.1 hypothetical protein SAMN05443638_1602 [Clostridium fallax]SQB07504.1 Uncharacterised protein [Clostridium fallax]
MEKKILILKIYFIIIFIIFSTLLLGYKNIFKICTMIVPGYSIANITENITMGKVNPKYGIDNYSIVELGDIAKSSKFDIQIISSEERNEIKANKNLYKLNNNKFIILKLKIRNSESISYKININDFSLENVTSKKSYVSDRLSFIIISNICDEKNNKNFAFFDDIDPKAIKYQYLIFQIPKEEKINDLMLLHYHTYFKIT